MHLRIPVLNFALHEQLATMHARNRQFLQGIWHTKACFLLGATYETLMSPHIGILAPHRWQSKPILQ
jgi:hypothetical protein